LATNWKSNEVQLWGWSNIATTKFMTNMYTVSCIT